MAAIPEKDPARTGNPLIIAKTQKRTGDKITASSVDEFFAGLKVQVFYRTLKKPCRIKMIGTDVPFFPFLYQIVASWWETEGITRRL